MLAYGNFLTVAINFLIVAWVLFMVVKAMNQAEDGSSRLRRRPRRPRTSSLLTRDPRPARQAISRDGGQRFPAATSAAI